MSRKNVTKRCHESTSRKDVTKKCHEKMSRVTPAGSQNLHSRVQAHSCSTLSSPKTLRKACSGTSGAMSSSGMSCSSTGFSSNKDEESGTDDTQANTAAACGNHHVAKTTDFGISFAPESLWVGFSAFSFVHGEFAFLLCPALLFLCCVVLSEPVSLCVFCSFSLLSTTAGSQLH